MTTEARTVPAVLERMARQLPDHEALVSPDRRFTFAQLRDEVRHAAAAMIALGVAPGRPRRDLVAEHLALGGGVPGRSPCRRGDGAAEHPLHRHGGHRHPGPHRCSAADRDGTSSSGQTGWPSLDRSQLPALRHIVRVPIEAGLDDQAGTWDEFMAARRPTSMPSTPARPPSARTTSATSCSRRAPPDAAKACCARTGSRCRRRRRGRPAGRSPATTAICASTRSSTTSATRPAFWPACRPAPR